MMEWIDIRLGDACTKIGSGATPRGGGAVYLDAGPIAFIRSQNIYNDGFSLDGMVYLDEKLAQGLANVQVEDLDVLLNITGDSVARACQVVEEVLPARVNQHVAIIRANQKVLWPTYLRYFLVSPAMQAHMLGLAAVGATRNALTKGMIESFSIRCPKEVDDQKAIADVLLSLDKKIAINRRINQTLEAMAQAIFKSWFVDFDPVKAKIAAIVEGRDPLRAAMTAISGKPDAELDTLPPEQYAQLTATAALFPDEMEESRLGEIPKGWRATDFGAVSKCLDKNRIPLSSREREKKKGAIPYYGATSVMDYVDEAIFDGVYLLLGEDGSVLKPDGTPFVQYIWGKSWVNNHAHVLMGANGISTEQLMLFISTQNISAYVTGAVQLKLNQKNMNSIPFIKAGNEINSCFSKAVAPFFAQHRLLVEEIRSLTELRDALLPKLLSGELSVAEVIAEVEA